MDTLRSIAKTSLLLVLLVAMSACTSTVHRRSDNMKADAKIGAGKTVVILKADIELYELLASGMMEPRADWTKAANAHVSEAITAELAQREVTVVQASTMDLPADERARQLELLSNTVGNAILQHEFSPYGRLPHRDRKSFEWTIGPGAQLLKQRYQADYAIATLVRDSYATSGRKAVMVLGLIAGFSAPLGSQQAYTTLVDLQTGRVVWANILRSETGDLRKPETARKTVSNLLKGVPL
jgi:hypothetical protein